MNLWEKLVAGLASFASGGDVRVNENTNGQQITFTATNEFGVKYNFKVKGDIEIEGSPVS